jgi:hypothetical protein
MQLPLKISYKEFKERLRPGSQQFLAWELKQLMDGVLMDGRDFDCRTVRDGWIFGRVPPTGESDWIDSEKIYGVLKAQGRIVDALSPRTPLAAIPGGTIASGGAKPPARAKVRKSPRRVARKTSPARKRKAAAPPRWSTRAARRSAASSKRASKSMGRENSRKG